MEALFEDKIVKRNDSLHVWAEYRRWEWEKNMVRMNDSASIGRQLQITRPYDMPDGHDVLQVAKESPGSTA